MARAYDHMTPFTRFNYFVAQRIHEIEDEIKELEAEQRMWDEPIVQPYTRVALEMVENRRINTGNRLLNLRNELTDWRRIDSVLDRCTACDGHGEIGYIEDPQDGARFRRCKKCDGKGTK